MLQLIQGALAREPGHELVSTAGYVSGGPPWHPQPRPLSAGVRERLGEGASWLASPRATREDGVAFALSGHGGVWCPDAQRQGTWGRSPDTLSSFPL